MRITTERKLSRKTPVYDHAGEFQFHATREEAHRLMAGPDVNIIQKGNRVRCLRFRGPDPGHVNTGSHHRPSIGTPHKRETDTNVRGVWTFPRIPDRCRPEFFNVVHTVRRALGKTEAYLLSTLVA